MADIDVSSFNLPNDDNNYQVKDAKARGIDCTFAQYEAWRQAGTLLADVDYHITDAINGNITMAMVVNAIYPVGSIYISVVDDTVAKVQARFGGTWESFGAGRTLVGVDPNDTSFDTVEETGGAKSNSYTPGGTVGDHTLTIDEMPAHTHRLNERQQWYGNDVVRHTSTGTIYSWKAGEGTGGSTSKSYRSGSDDIESKGGSGAHNHGWTGTAANISTVQPYITTYMYKRTA